MVQTLSARRGCGPHPAVSFPGAARARIFMHKSSLAALVLLLTVITASPAAAQAPAADSWKITVAPYFMGAALNGPRREPQQTGLD